MMCLRFGPKIAAIDFTTTRSRQSIDAAIFADRKHIISPCGSRQVDGTRNIHKTTRKCRMF